MFLAKAYNMRLTLLAATTLVALAQPSLAADVTGAYTKIDFEKTCKVIEEIKEGGSVSMRCEGYRDYVVHFAEGDLRHAVRFGYIDKNAAAIWQSFGQWNQIGTTVEWRLAAGKPFAAILRWFIENTDDEGSADPNKVGQVLVVSRVGQPEDKQSCVVGYVDALANRNANAMARELADSHAVSFECGKDTPAYHGTRGGLSGNPG